MHSATINFGGFGSMFVRLLAAGMLALVGCQNPSERLNAPPQGACERQHPMQEDYVQMTDNAMLEDMSVSPVHFVPHTAQLNGNGARLLKRYATLLKLYGGTLRYDGGAEDRDLALNRTAEITQFLQAEGVAAERFKVIIGLPGGRGMAADEAIVARDNARVKPGETNGGGGPGLIGLVGAGGGGAGSGSKK